VTVDDGFLQVHARGGRRHRPARTLAYTAKRLDDSHWHRVRLGKLDRTITVAVDDLPPAVLEEAGPRGRLTRRRMYVGGVPPRVRRLFDAVYGEDAEAGGRLAGGFVGCLRRLHVDHHVQNEAGADLVATARDVIPCAHTRDVAYIHDGGYALFGRCETINYLFIN
jgi:hypothetical protein